MVDGGVESGMAIKVLLEVETESCLQNHVYSMASHLAIRSQTMLTGIILYYLVT